MLIDICLIIGAYLIGSIPYMLMLSRAKGFDLSNEPDFHIAMYRKVGRWEGFSGVLVDFLKGLIPVLIGYYLNLDLWAVAGSAVAATVGQMWPVFQKFDGEKGNTTGLGAATALTLCYDAGWVLLAAVIFMLFGFLIRTIPRFMVRGQTFKDMLGFGGPVSNSMPIGMLLGFAVMPLVSWLLDEPWEMSVALLLILVFIIVRRLTASVRKDISEGKSSTGRILLNRLFLDRSYYRE
jgi:glycerol-3-phosphate acyltransferase PlsY